MVWAYPNGSQLRDTIDSHYPTAALRFMQEEQIRGRRSHFYDYGGYIEWMPPVSRLSRTDAPTSLSTTASSTIT